MGAQWKAAGKLATANARSKAFNKLTKDLIMAAKAGPDPSMNARLRAAVEAAKKGSLPRDNIERAIKRGAGLLDDPVTYETVTYEGFTPHRVPVVVECLTDNKNRTATTVRVLFRKGQIAAHGAVTWDFSYLGIVDATSPDGADVEEAAIECNAQDFEAGGEDGTRFYTDPADLDQVSKALSARGWNVATIRLGWRAKNPVKLEDPAHRTEVEAFLAELDADDDVQHIYVGLAD